MARLTALIDAADQAADRLDRSEFLDAVFAWARTGSSATLLEAGSFCESFAGRMRDELLEEPVPRPRSCAIRIANWIDDYNQQPHSALSHANGLYANLLYAIVCTTCSAPPIACCSARAA